MLVHLGSHYFYAQRAHFNSTAKPTIQPGASTAKHVGWGQDIKKAWDVATKAIHWYEES